MAKFHGIVGYVETVETEPGVWVEEKTERTYTGDFLRNSRQLQNSGNLNDSINLSNKISIIADPFAVNKYYAIRYVEYMGAKWKVSDVEIQYPRLILTVGGLYNGN